MRENNIVGPIIIYQNNQNLILIFYDAKIIFINFPLLYLTIPFRYSTRRILNFKLDASARAIKSERKGASDELPKSSPSRVGTRSESVKTRNCLPIYFKLSRESSTRFRME